MEVIRKIAGPVILFLGLFCLTNCSRKEIYPANGIQYDFEVKHYDQYYEIDPDINIFKSKQKIVLLNVSNTPTDKIVFSIHPSLVIDQTLLKNTSDGPIKIKTGIFFMYGGHANSMNGLARAVLISLPPGPLNSLEVKRSGEQYGRGKV